MADHEEGEIPDTTPADPPRQQQPAPATKPYTSSFSSNIGSNFSGGNSYSGNYHQREFSHSRDGKPWYGVGGGVVGSSNKNINSRDRGNGGSHRWGSGNDGSRGFASFNRTSSVPVSYTAPPDRYEALNNELDSLLNSITKPKASNTNLSGSNCSISGSRSVSNPSSTSSYSHGLNSMQAGSSKGLNTQSSSSDRNHPLPPIMERATTMPAISTSFPSQSAPGFLKKPWPLSEHKEERDIERERERDREGDRQEGRDRRREKERERGRARGMDRDKERDKERESDKGKMKPSNVFNDKTKPYSSISGYSTANDKHAPSSSSSSSSSSNTSTHSLTSPSAFLPSFLSPSSERKPVLLERSISDSCTNRQNLSGQGIQKQGNFVVTYYVLMYH